MVAVEGLEELFLVLVDGGLLSDIFSLFLFGRGFLFWGLSLLDSLLESLSLFKSRQSPQHLSSSQRLGVRIQLDHGAQILQWILFVHHILLMIPLPSEGRLDLLRVDQTAQIRASQNRSGKSVIDFDGRRSLVGTIKCVELLEGTSSPNHQTSQMSSWSQLKQIQSRHTAKLHSRQVSESTAKRGLGVVDNQRSSSLSVSPVS